MTDAFDFVVEFSTDEVISGNERWLETCYRSTSVCTGITTRHVNLLDAGASHANEGTVVQVHTLCQLLKYTVGRGGSFR